MTRPEATALDGARVLVLGLGRFSGGVETARFLRERGAEVVVSDTAAPEALEESAREARRLGATLRFGPQGDELLDGVDLVVANPAVPFEAPILAAAARRGVPVTTETNLFLARVRAPVLGVTGTKGKSTTATLLAAMLAAAGRRVHLGGNVGRALVAEVDRIAPEDLVVLELSSFQLWWTRRIERSPHVAVVTNLFPDHLDRHGTLEAYAEAKRAILDFQRPTDAAVLPVADPGVRAAGFLTAGRARRVLVGDGGAFRLEGSRILGDAGEVGDLEGFALWGRHNRENALLAAAAALQVPGVRGDAVVRGALATRPLAHRLEPVTEVDGVLFVDDSIATNPGSAIAALDAVPRPAVVLVGGKAKGLDPEPLLEALARRARAVVGIGTSGPEVVRRLRGRVHAVEGGTGLESAVETAFALARRGDAVLLSPGYSSLDEHASFAARGERFQRAARALLAARAGAGGPVGRGSLPSG